MARISLFENEALDAAQLEQVRAVEAGGGDASVMRAIAHRPEMFERYFAFYYPAHNQGVVEPELKELVRLKIARLNDCFT